MDLDCSSEKEVDANELENECVSDRDSENYSESECEDESVGACGDDLHDIRDGNSRILELLESLGQDFAKQKQDFTELFGKT